MCKNIPIICLKTKRLACKNCSRRKHELPEPSFTCVVALVKEGEVARKDRKGITFLFPAPSLFAPPLLLPGFNRVFKSFPCQLTQGKLPDRNEKVNSDSRVPPHLLRD